MVRERRVDVEPVWVSVLQCGDYVAASDPVVVWAGVPRFVGAVPGPVHHGCHPPSRVASVHSPVPRFAGDFWDSAGMGHPPDPVTLHVAAAGVPYSD